MIEYELSASWIIYNLNGAYQEMVEAKSAVLSLQSIPYKREWVEDMQYMELKREIAGTSRIEGADFTGLVSMLATQAFFSLGIIRSEEDKDTPPDLRLAQYNIDMLDIIKEKTKGNLSDEEDKFIEGTLHQLRMAFVQVSGQDQKDT